MCSSALFGLALAAGALAIHPEQSPFGSSDDGRTITIVWAVGCCASSAAAFTYMLLRYNGRYRLSTLFKIALFWFGVLATVRTNPDIAVRAGVPLILVDALVWSFRPKDCAE